MLEKFKIRHYPEADSKGSKMRKILSSLVIVSASAWATPSSPLLPESDGARVSVPISARSEQRSVKKNLCF